MLTVQEWRLRLQGVHPAVVRRGVSAICIDGFMRSGNTFTVDTFKQANPGVEVAHHLHSTGHLRRALKFGVPVLVLIRQPADAIVSYMIYQGEEDPDDAFFRYLLFYRWVRRHLDDVVVVDFDTATTDFNAVVRRVNERYGTDFAGVPDLEQSHEEVFAEISGRFDRHRGDATARLPLPSRERDAIKEALRPLVQQHPKLREAEALYHAIVSGA